MTDDNMETSVPEVPIEESMGRAVSASILASFLRNFATTYLNRDERRIFFAFQRFASDMERKEMENLRCRR
ncbi:MAG: hypothetical protein IJ248_03255 [Candidatus Methanomethylophilaceae archaeon]|nr:hypothetical protein [Candidatus Methanomethylophilaceae archaeon]